MLGRRRKSNIYWSVYFWTGRYLGKVGYRLDLVGKINYVILVLGYVSHRLWNYHVSVPPPHPKLYGREGTNYNQRQVLSRLSPTTSIITTTRIVTPEMNELLGTDDFPMPPEGGIAIEGDPTRYKPAAGLPR